MKKEPEFSTLTTKEKMELLNEYFQKDRKINFILKERIIDFMFLNYTEYYEELKKRANTPVLIIAGKISKCLYEAVEIDTKENGPHRVVLPLEYISNLKISSR